MEDSAAGKGDQHLTALQLLCRVCGEKVKPAKKRRNVYNCINHSTDLRTTFGIDVLQDKPTIHPTHFCHSCKVAIYNAKTKGITLQKVFSWKQHNGAACETCLRAMTVQVGGRRAKANIGRPAILSKRSLLSHIRHVALPSYQPLSESKEAATHRPCTITTPPQYAVAVDDLVCCICINILNQPIELTSCGSVVCADCVSRWLSECSECLPCPCCHRNLHGVGEIRKAPYAVQKLLSGLLITCTCGSTVTQGAYTAHVKGEECSSDVSHAVSIHDVIAQPVYSPLTPIEKELQTTLAKRSLATSPEENVIHMKTGGQVSTPI